MTESAQRRAANGASSVEKALDVLLCFSPEEPELGVSEIARRLGVAASTAHRLLHLLMRKDFVRQNPATGKYCLGFRVVHLASTVVARSTLRAGSLPYMLTLRDATGETVRLYLLSGREHICIEEVESSREPRPPRCVGSADPLYRGAAGRVMLAYLPDRDVQQILLEFQRTGASADGRVDGLGTELDQIRLRGFALGPESQAGDTRCLAVPVRNYTGAAIGSLAVIGPAERWTEQRALSFASEATEHGRAISRALGYAGQPASTDLGAAR